jgi:Virulence factor BrkB
LAERGPANTFPTKTVTLNLADHDELLRLRKENERLRMEREILKKAAGDSTGHCNSGVTSSFGAAESVIALLLWVYYSAQIFFFGAEFTRQYTLKFDSLSNAINQTERDQVGAHKTVD